MHAAMTRTKDQLNLVVPQRFYNHKQAEFGDGHVYRSVSRFIPKSIRHFFEMNGPSEHLGQTRTAYIPAGPGLAPERQRVGFLGQA